MDPVPLAQPVAPTWTSKVDLIRSVVSFEGAAAAAVSAAANEDEVRAPASHKRR
jgi:hypothetical protein